MFDDRCFNDRNRPSWPRSLIIKSSQKQRDTQTSSIIKIICENLRHLRIAIPVPTSCHRRLGWADVRLLQYGWRRRR